MSSHDVNPAAERSERSYIPSRVVRHEHAEGSFTRLLEQQAAKVPSDVFLFSALSAMALALGLELRGHSRWARFVGMWPGPLLTMGVYNKLLKVWGSG